MTIHTVQMGPLCIGPGERVPVIAEAGVNHNGDMDTAHRLIEIAAEKQADAVKFQAFVTEEVITPKTPKAQYQVQTTGTDDGQFDMAKALELSPMQQAELKQHCERLGLTYLCTPYDAPSVDVLDEMDVVAYKVASTDVTNLPLLARMASKGRPVILSTGWSSLGEIEAAIMTLRDGGVDEKIVLLQCTSEYPAPVEDANLRAIQTLQQAFACPVGFSDHTEGVGASPWAVAAGASVIEKHFTLDRTMLGPDHQASLDPDQLSELITAVRGVEVALGDGVKRIMPSEAPNKERMQKSLVTRRRIEAGELVAAGDVTAKRPGTGLPPSWFDRVVGLRAARNLEADEVLQLDSILWDHGRDAD
jgi:N,N'-diacetyllegionaminate synthase